MHRLKLLYLMHLLSFRFRELVTVLEQTQSPLHLTLLSSTMFALNVHLATLTCRLDIHACTICKDPLEKDLETKHIFFQCAEKP